MHTNAQSRELNIGAISGPCWPTKSRKYLINLVKEAVVKAQAKSVIIAGHTVDGKYVEAEFRAQLKEHLETFSPRLKGERLDWEKGEFERRFIEEAAAHLSDFLPVLPSGVNWHIAIAERIYDWPIGARILEKLRELRTDVRIIGERQEDGYYDREPKFPVQFPGFEEIRVLVPHRSPWFSAIITNLVQRITNAWSPRTLSPKPGLVLVGVTGTATHLPYLDGVPTISVPALHKLLEKQATEHMIGATIIRIIANGKEGVRIVNGVHNFRTAAFLEKQVAVSKTLPAVQQAVMHALIPSDASLKTVLHRVNKAESRKRFLRKTKFSDSQVRTALEQLVKAETAIFSKKSNRWAINEELRRNANITLESLWKGSRSVKHVVWSCLHGGALKSLYFTFLQDIPCLADDADALIENGDLTQGIAHTYEYNGELLPIANGVDKHELIGAHLRATAFLTIFRNRLVRMGKAAKEDPSATLEKCLVPYAFKEGNHDAWGYFGKRALILQLFEDRLRTLMTEGVMGICREHGVAVSFEQAKAVVAAKIIRVGESRMVELGGILVGVKPPYKSRTIQKSTRIQQVADFIWRRFDSYVGSVAKEAKAFSIAYVANFHEAAAAHITKFGQTILGVMTGAYLKDTEFENNQDKVVDHGPAVVTARFDTEGRLLYSETEFVSHICEEDRSFVASDRLDSTAVLQRCIKLLDRIGLTLPWR